MIAGRKTIIDISSGTIFRVILFGLGLWFVWFLRDILLLLLVSVLIASALEPIAGTFNRKFRIPRALSVLTVYGIFLLIIIGFVTLLVPPLVTEIQTFAKELPTRYAQLEELVGRAALLIGIPDTVTDIQARLMDFTDVIARATGGIFATTRAVFGGVIAVVFILVISFYLVLSRDALLTFVRSITPKEHHPYLLHLVECSQRKIGRWVSAQLTLCVVVGVLTWIGLTALGIPYALALALLAAFMELIPVLGPILSAVPSVLLGFIISPLTGLLVIIVYLVIQQAENHLLIPVIMRRAIGLNPLATIIAVLIGWQLAGLLGVLLAVPIATIVGVFVSDIIPVVGEEEELSA